MANAIYNKGLQKFLEGSIAWLTDAIKIVLVDTGAYTFSAAHEFLSDVPGGARIATSGNLASKTSTDGVADAADITFTAVSGTTVEAFVVYKDTGSAATSPLIAYFDTVSAGLPVTPNGGDITIQFDSGANRIFKI